MMSKSTMRTFLGLAFLYCRVSAQFDCIERSSCQNSNFESVDIDINCIGNYSCFGSTLLQTSGLGHINCDGYQSCENTARLETTGTGQINCNGVESCYNADLIQTSGSSGTSHINCNGRSSCSSLNERLSLKDLEAEIFCNGDSSCYSSVVVYDDSETASSDTLNRLETPIRCNGYNSCRSADLTMDYGATFYGALSAQDAHIHDSGIDINLIIGIPIFYNFYAHDAASRARISCQEKTDCNVVCSGTSCNNIDIAASDSLTFTCDYAVKSDACPDGYETSFSLETPSFSQYYSHYFSNMDNGNNSRVIGGKIEYASQSDLVSTAYYGIFGRTVDTVDNVLCLAREACTNAKFNNISGHVYAYAYHAMKNSTIDNVGGNIYVDGYQALSKSNIYNVNGNIVGFTFGWDITIDNVGGDITSYGRETLGGSTISNVMNGTVYVEGERALMGATVSDVYRLECHGTQCLQYSATIENVDYFVYEGVGGLDGATIKNVKNMELDGKFILRNAQIIFDMEAGSNMTASFNGSAAGQFTLTCARGNICNLICQSSDICSQLKADCEGLCIPHCDEDNGISCPRINVITTLSPTKAPSAAPTPNLTAVYVDYDTTEDTNDVGSEGSDKSDNDDEDSSVGGIVGGVIGGLAFLALIAVGVFYYRKRVEPKRRATVTMSKLESNPQPNITTAGNASEGPAAVTKMTSTGI